MTLQLSENHKVRAVVLPEVMRCKPDDVAVFAQDRKGGLILRSVSFPKNDTGRVRIRQGRGRSAA